METPFIYGKIVTGRYLINLENEKKRLINNFQNGITIILISPSVILKNKSSRRGDKDLF
jgi:hypothetical protein